MTFLLTLICFLLTVFFAWRRSGRKAVTFLALSILTTIGFGQGWLAGGLLNHIQSFPPLENPQWKERNAIVVLGIGVVKWPQGEQFTTHSAGYSRLFEGFRLYHHCKTAKKICRIVPTGGDPAKLGETEAEVMKRELMQIGVPASDILIEDRSQNTFQNAQFTAKLLQEQPVDHVVIVSSGLHVRRASLYFAHFGVRGDVAPADRMNPRPIFLPLGYNYFMVDVAFHEVLGVWRYHIYNWMGWNPVLSHPGSL